MKEILEQRKTQCAKLLADLLDAAALPFDEKLVPTVQEEHGLYLIARRDDLGQCEYLHAGVTGCTKRKRATGLRGRMDDHFNGGGKGAGSDLVQKVIDYLHAELGIAPGPVNPKTRNIAQAWISKNCIVQWLVVGDDELRCWAEHYMLSILRPIWGC